MTPAERTLTKACEVHQKETTVFARALDQFHRENFNVLTESMEIPSKGSRASMSMAITAFDKSERVYLKAVATYYATPKGK